MSKDTKTYDPLQDPDYMGPTMLNYFRDLLLLEREAAVAGAQAADEVLHSEVVLEPTVANDEDWETHQEEGALQEKIAARDSKLIGRIDKALSQIKKGDYGNCAIGSCGDEIGVGRLMARPSALLCIECKNAQEHRERQGA